MVAREFYEDRLGRPQREERRGTTFGIGGFSPTGSTAKDAAIGFTAGEGTGIRGQNYAAIMDPVGQAQSAGMRAAQGLTSLAFTDPQRYGMAMGQFDRPLGATMANPYGTPMSQMFGGADYSNLLNERQRAQVLAANMRNAAARAQMVGGGMSPEQAAQERPFGLREIMGSAISDFAETGGPMIAAGRGIMDAFRGLKDYFGSPAEPPAPESSVGETSRLGGLATVPTGPLIRTSGEAYNQVTPADIMAQFGIPTPEVQIGEGTLSFEADPFRGQYGATYTAPMQDLGLGSLADFFSRRARGI